MKLNNNCPNCGSYGLSKFFKIQNVPANSVLLLGTRNEALNFPMGNVILGFCNSCGFISNIAFDPELLEYSNRYESTQAYSPTFNAYHRNLAKKIINRYDLYNKDIFEIGCGQGEFLTLICELGGNRGIGFDPVYKDDRSSQQDSGKINFINDFYSEKYSYLRSDFICCKMTLEHIPDTANFLGMIRRSIENSSNTIIYFQVPDVSRILQELAFWDIYYEHCSYFSLGSLARLFRRCGFGIIDLEKDYNNQYINITANLLAGEGSSFDSEDDLEILRHDVANFAANYQKELDSWRHKILEKHKSGKRIVIWGASSKGVAFLNTLNLRREIKYAVDINPSKHETYIPGTGQKIVSPEYLLHYKPDVVIVMNPIYVDEIRETLKSNGVKAEIVTT